MAILFKSVLFILLWMTHRLKLFCNLHVQCIYSTHGLYTVYHTYHAKQSRVQRGDRPPPPPRFVKGKVLCRGLIGRREGPTVLFTLLLSFFILQTYYTYTHFRVQCFNSMERSSFFYISLIQIMKSIQLTIPCFMIGHFHILLSRITRFNTI